MRKYERLVFGGHDEKYGCHARDTWDIRRSSVIGMDFKYIPFTSI